MTDTEPLAQTLVDYSGTLVDDFDIHGLLDELMQRCVHLLGVDAAGVLLADEHRRLHVVAVSGERGDLVDLLQRQTEQPEGPCLECYRLGRPIAAQPAADPRPQPSADLGVGHETVVPVAAVPVRHQRLVLGTLVLFGPHATIPISESDLILAQAFADLGSIALLHQSLVTDPRRLADAVTSTLHGRVAIEQAKGALAARLGITMTEAFRLLQARANDTVRHLAQTADEVIGGTWAVHVHD